MSQPIAVATVPSQPGTLPGVAWYAEGTGILTPKGELPIERLAVGDVVQLLSGRTRPIRSIGHATIACAAQADRAEAWPIRIAPDAFGAGRPARPLFLSPGHAICVDVLGEVLVRAADLQNGATVAQVPLDAVTYYHLELDGAPDVILAEGLPTYADSETVGADGRPLHTGGPVVEAVRLRLGERARMLGWHHAAPSLDDVALEVGGTILRPDVTDNVLRFTLPAGVRNVWLLSPVSVPAHVTGAADQRRLGVCVAVLALADGRDLDRRFDAAWPALSDGFFALEHDGAVPFRWTDGRARLPDQLFQGCVRTSLLEIELRHLPLPRWAPPPEGVPASNGLGEPIPAPVRAPRRKRV